VAAHAHRRASAALRLEWGPTGGAAISPGCGIAVVVDVLSFTTTLTVAVDTAAELDVSRSVPVLRDGAFVAG
jgi:hypothetical protein